MLTDSLPAHSSAESPNLRFTRKHCSCQSGVSFRIVDTRLARHATFELVYRRYVEDQLIQPNGWGLRVTPWQLLPRTNIFAAIENRRVICTVTLVADSSLGLPMERVYGAEIRARRRQGLYLGEVSCLAFERMSYERFLWVFMPLTRLMAQHARAYGMDQFVIVVRAKHAKFYEHLMGFQRIGPVTDYPLARRRPSVACCLDFASIDRFRPPSYDTYFGKTLPQAALVARPMSCEDRHYFQTFVDESACGASEASCA